MSDLIEDIKRKAKVTPILLMINMLFLGVPIFIAVMDGNEKVGEGGWVIFGSNFGSMIIVILCALLVKEKCFKEKVTMPEMTSYLYVLISIWLTILISVMTVLRRPTAARGSNVRLAEIYHL